MSSNCYINPDTTSTFPEARETADRIRKALKEDLKSCRFSRSEVVWRVNSLGGKITTALLDAYVAESKCNRFPADLVPIWTKVMDSRRLLDAIAGEVGLFIATTEDQDFAELGRIQLRKEALSNLLMRARP
jgi:hypothetical protein